MRIQVGASARCKTDRLVVKAIERYADKEPHAKKVAEVKSMQTTKAKKYIPQSKADFWWLTMANGSKL